MTLDTRARRAARGIHRAVEVMERSTTTEEPRKVERFDRFRERKDRNRRVGAIAIAGALAIVVTVIATSGALDRGLGTVPVDPGTGQTGPPVFAEQIGTVTATAENGMDVCRTDSTIGRGHLDGLTTVNDSEDRAAFELVRFGLTDVTFSDFEAYVTRERRRAEAGEPLLGPPKGVEIVMRVQVRAGASETIDRTIPPGRYALVCLRSFGDEAGMRPYAVAGPVVFE